MTETKGLTMSTTPTAMSPSAWSRPRALGSFQVDSVGGNRAYGDHMSTEHRTAVGTTVVVTVGTNGSKRLEPGFLAGVLT